MDRVITKIIQDVANKNNVDFETARVIYMDMFRFIRGKLEKVDFENIVTEEDLRKAKTNFNIPRIIKLYTTPNRVDYAREAIRKNGTQYDKGSRPYHNIQKASSIDTDTPGPDRVE